MTKNNTKPTPPATSPPSAAASLPTVGVIIAAKFGADAHHSVNLAPDKKLTQLLHVFAGIKLEPTTATQIVLQRLNPSMDTELLDGDVLIVDHDPKD